MDLIEDLEEKQRVFEQKKARLQQEAHSLGLQAEVSKTSIWDKTLYSAWSKIVTQLVPHKDKFEEELKVLIEAGADEGRKFYEKMYFLDKFFFKRLNFFLIPTLLNKTNDSSIDARCWVDLRKIQQNRSKNFSLTQFLRVWISNFESLKNVCWKIA